MSHFARLRLLDPDRFPDYEKFIEEEQSYQPIATAIQPLLNEPQLSTEAFDNLRNVLGEGEDQQMLHALQQHPKGSEAHDSARDTLINHLLDRHGTGRVLFRNTRAAIKGFPARQSHLYPLPLPAAYREVLIEFENSSLNDPQQLLCPELLYQSTDNPTPWYQFDPRVSWLQEILKTVRPADRKSVV